MPVLQCFLDECFQIEPKRKRSIARLSCVRDQFSSGGEKVDQCRDQTTLPAVSGSFSTLNMLGSHWSWGRLLGGRNVDKECADVQLGMWDPSNNIKNIRCWGTRILGSKGEMCNFVQYMLWLATYGLETVSKGASQPCLDTSLASHTIMEPIHLWPGVNKIYGLGDMGVI